jgi:hypothetical protein
MRSKAEKAEIVAIFTPELISAFAKALSDYHARKAGIDREDGWAIYGDSYIDDVKGMLAEFQN